MRSTAVKNFPNKGRFLIDFETAFLVAFGYVFARICRPLAPDANPLATSQSSHMVSSSVPPPKPAPLLRLPRPHLLPILPPYPNVWNPRALCELLLLLPPPPLLLLLLMQHGACLIYSILISEIFHSTHALFASPPPPLLSSRPSRFLYSRHYCKCLYNLVQVPTAHVPSLASCFMLPIPIQYRSLCVAGSCSTPPASTCRHTAAPRAPHPCNRRHLLFAIMPLLCVTFRAGSACPSSSTRHPLFRFLS
jgi:hypothetical protein